MKVKDLAFFLNKLNDNGFDDVELYTHWEDFKDKYPETPEFHLHLNGINEQEILKWWPQNPFSPGVEFYSFGILKECSIHEKEVELSGCFDVYNQCLENKKWIDHVSKVNHEMFMQQLKDFQTLQKMNKGES